MRMKWASVKFQGGSYSSRFLLLTNTCTNVFLRKNIRKNTHVMSHIVFFYPDVMCKALFNQLHFASVTKKKKEKSIVFQSQDLCAISLFSPLTIYLSFSLLCWTFHSQVMSQSFLQVPHLVLKQPDNLLHQLCGLHILQNEGSWPHLLSGMFSLWPPTYSVSPYFICSLLCFTCKSRKWALSADFSLLTSEQLSPTTQSYVLLLRTI